MGKPTGFLEVGRQDRSYDKVSARVATWKEFVHELPDEVMKKQGGRCMDCGIPFCHNGCPVNNLIPDWNDLVYKNKWREALTALHSTNNFPEFTGRICPAPCEAACTLNINDDAVTIKSIECAIVDRGWAEGWITPQPAARKTGKKIAVIGSGPAGMAAAQQLARVGHNVTLFEKDDRIGGLLRYGIPDFKMEKHLIDRRITQMMAEGVTFKPDCHVGRDIDAGALLKDFDAVLLTGGAQVPRDLPVPGRELQGIHFAMEFLAQNNKRVAGDKIPDAEAIMATGKHVVVIGGGDTGSDCIGTSIRQGAASVTQLEIMPRPPEQENKPMVWPYWPLKFRTSSSQEEGCEREFAVATKAFIGEGGKVKSQQIVQLAQGQEVPGSAQNLQADLVLLAMGFVHPTHAGLLKDLGVALDARGNVQADTLKYQTSVPQVFTAGDMRRGQSLVVWAIREGRQAARAVDEFLMGASDLPR
ncbi:MAG: glutamate synthase subunit beta [Proteobacteria bacterium]|nr:glutamate synthase subunit beta [Pseudomonadota bacterium]